MPFEQLTKSTACIPSILINSTCLNLPEPSPACDGRAARSRAIVVRTIRKPERNLDMLSFLRLSTPCGFIRLAPLLLKTLVGESGYSCVRAKLKGCYRLAKSLYSAGFDQVLPVEKPTTRYDS